MKNGSTLGLIVIGIVVLLGGAFAGYYYMGGGANGRQLAQAPTVSPDQTTDSAPPPTQAVVHRQIAVPGQYTAPGAPNIEIVETKAPAKVKPTAVATDSEASQTGVANPPIGLPSDTTGSVYDGNNNTSNAVAAANGVETGDQTTNPSNPSDDSSQPGMPDTGTGSTPSSAAPAGADTPPTPAAAFGASLFRVQAGAFQSQKNADILQDALRAKGYAATTLPRLSNGNSMFVVQVGAYSDRVTADETVASLQHDGFPATVSIGQ